MKITRQKVSPSSIGGSYRFGFQAVSISPAQDAWASSKLSLRPASLKRSSSKKIFLQSEKFLLNRCVIKTAVLLLVLSLLFIAQTGQTLAEERSIYVGDLIKIQISAEAYTKDQLTALFTEKDFEIVDIKDEAGDYLLTLRTFEPGEKSVRIGNKEIQIDVKSTLKDIKRDGIFEGDINTLKPAFSVEWRYIFYVLMIAMIPAGGIVLRSHLKNRKIFSLTPYQLFIRQTESIPEEDGKYFVKLTSSFKAYLEAVYSCRLRGKTSSELTDRISNLPGLQEYIPDIRFWLTESDRFKFTGENISGEKKREMSEQLAALVYKIRNIKEVKEVKEVKEGEV
jgi:hypothetical protein